MKRSIWVVTTSRADYGLLRNLLTELKNDSRCELKIIATGMHLSERAGNTYKQIEKDEFEIYKKLDMDIAEDTASSIIRSIGIGCYKFADLFENEKPEILVVLGDRFELLPVLISCLVNNIVVAHIHGGESSEGAIDESIRHSVSKMSHIHFPAAEEYKERLIQLGENPENIFNFGAPGLDNIHQMKFLSRKDFFDKIGLNDKAITALVTFHPTTIENTSAKEQAVNITEAIDECGLNAIFTASNADKNGNSINEVFIEFCKDKESRFKFIQNLGSELYLNALKNTDLMIGNSSSGLTEAPSFKLPVINIGSRQDGRIKAANILDCSNSKDEIKNAIAVSQSEEFKNKLKELKNPYDSSGDGKTSFRIKEKLLSIKSDRSILKKKFYKFNKAELDQN